MHTSVQHTPNVLLDHITENSTNTVIKANKYDVVEINMQSPKNNVGSNKVGIIVVGCAVLLGYCVAAFSGALISGVVSACFCKIPIENIFNRNITEQSIKINQTNNNDNSKKIFDIPINVEQNGESYTSILIEYES